MRTLGVLLGVSAAALLWAASAGAQQALRAAAIGADELPDLALTLRPGAGLEDLAARVAAVLELRTGQSVSVGEPPPEVVEAVPEGHVALVENGAGGIQVVLGAPGGASFVATVERDGSRAPEARAVALAVEALRDEAVDASVTTSAPVPSPARLPAPEKVEPALPRATPGPEPSVDTGDPADEAPARLLGDVDPFVFVRTYAGASTSSNAPMTGFGVGAGMCVERECLVIEADLPIGFADGSVDDLRYRYLTFLSGFYSRPISFGSLTPGASLGFLTRLGHFRRDLGLADDGLDTDLGARGTLELGWEVLADMDLLAEGGVDLTLDRHEVPAPGGRATRGERWSPWLQAVVRYRP